jgi:hypothetical protein
MPPFVEEILHHILVEHVKDHPRIHIGSQFSTMQQKMKYTPDPPNQSNLHYSINI